MNRLLLLLILLGSQQVTADRWRVPDYFECDRNQVTSWTGKIGSYWRDNGELSFTLLTDADTHQRLQLKFDTQQQLITHFYIDNRAFEALDWPSLEPSAGKLKPNQRATVWLCLDNSVLPVINWHSDPK